MLKEIKLTHTVSITDSLLADLILVFTQWECQWECKDFIGAFKDSPHGWEYYWKKFQVCDRLPFVLFTTLDNAHQRMLVVYLFAYKYKCEIENYEASREIFLQADISKQWKESI